MRIPQFVLDDFLTPYSNASRYLISAEDLDNGTRGDFSIRQSVYLARRVSSGHLNIVDLFICFNQLAYVGLAEKVRAKTVPELADIDYDHLKNSKLEGLIYAVDELRFKKAIDSTGFSGQMEIEQIRRKDRLYFVRTSFNFENSATGNIRIAMRLE